MLNALHPNMENESIGLGDTVSHNWNGSWKDGWDSAMVSQVHADGTVDLFRPYASNAGFSCAGSEKDSSRVICYIGIEESKRCNPKYLKLLRKSTPLK